MIDEMQVRRGGTGTPFVDEYVPLSGAETPSPMPFAGSQPIEIEAPRATAISPHVAWYEVADCDVTVEVTSVGGARLDSFTEEDLLAGTFLGPYPGGSVRVEITSNAKSVPADERTSEEKAAFRNGRPPSALPVR